MKCNQSPFTLVAVCSALAAVLIFLPVSSQAQRDRSLTARDAIELVSKQFGAERAEWIVEMRGYEGVPEPQEWEIRVWDPQARHMIREYWAGEGRATDEGNDDDFYPEQSPFGFIRVTDLKLDSKAAFVIAEGEARKARMGFDSLNYFLRCREFSREPVWTLELLDTSEEIVGKVYISGTTGEVLRSVWIYRGSRGRPDGRALVVDTAAPRDGGRDASAGARSGTTEDRKPEEESDETKIPPKPTPEPDPLSPPVPNSSKGGGGTDTRIPPPPIPDEP